MAPAILWRGVLAVFLIVMGLGAPPARAGCSLEDIGGDIWGGLKATMTCKTACETQAGCAASIALAGALTGVAMQGSDTGKGQPLVDNFCAQAKGATEDILKTLNTVFGNALSEAALGDLSKQLAAVGSLASVVKCACETEQNVGSLGSDLGACVEEALCGAQEWVGLGSCDCERPPPRTAICTSIDVTACQGLDLIHRMRKPECAPGGSIANCNDTWRQCGYAGYAPSVAKIDTPQGTLVIQSPPSAEGAGCNDPVQSCFCPKPMVPAWHEVANPGSGDHRFIFSCDCPSGTHPGGSMADGLSICLCDATNKQANMGFAPFGMCPPPECPKGQTRLSADGPCVTPCADPKQGMTFDGACCDPNQMSSCGACCPPDTIPDPKSGSCVPRPKPPK